jgi:flagellar hook assembly protein FlgD
LPPAVVGPGWTASPAAAALDVRANPTGDAFVTPASARRRPRQVFDAAGRRIATLFDGEAPAGPLRLAWNGKGTGGVKAPSGVYWIRAEAAGERFVRKQAVLR